MRARSNQGGWIVNFAVVGMLLVLGLIASAYYLKAYYADSNAPSDEGVKIASQDDASKDKEQSSSSDAQKDKTSTSKNDSSAPSKENEDNNSTTTQSQTEKTKDTNATGNKEKESSVAKNNAQVLPATGPTSLALNMIAIVVLAYSAALYQQSRHALR